MSDPDTQMRHDNADASRWRIPGVVTLLVLVVFVICTALLLGLYASQSGIRRVRALGGGVEFDSNAVSDIVTEFVDIDPGPLATDADVTFVWLDGPDVTDDTLSVLRRFPSVRDLSIIQSNVTDDGLEQLAAATTITSLQICETPQITDAGIAKLSRLPQLMWVELQGVPVTGEGIAALNQIDILYLDGCPGVDDTTLEHIGGLSNLTDLSLAGSAVTDAGLSHLAGLTRLHALILDQTRVTDEGLATIVKLLPDLDYLSLSEVRGISDEGVLRLVELKSLSTLNVQYTRISDDAVGRLSQALRGCNLIHSQIPLTVPTPTQ